MYEGIESLQITKQPAWKTVLAVIGLILAAAFGALLIWIMLVRHEDDAALWVKNLTNGAYIMMWIVEGLLLAISLRTYRQRKRAIRV